MSGVPVVVTSRCGAGTTGAAYGTPGGGRTLRDRGTIPGGDLAPWKARLKLALALEAVETEPGVEDASRYFSDRAEPDRSDSTKSDRSNCAESE